MTARYTKGIYRGMTPYQRQDAEDFGDWPDDEPLPITMEARDCAPPPPARLDPTWILRMRQRIDRFRETGVVDWIETKGAD